MRPDLPVPPELLHAACILNEMAKELVLQFKAKATPDLLEPQLAMLEVHVMNFMRKVKLAGYNSAASTRVMAQMPLHLRNVCDQLHQELCILQELQLELQMELKMLDGLNVEVATRQ